MNEKQISPVLFISKDKTKQGLTKKQQEFNRLINKTEILRKNIDRQSTELNELLTYYISMLHPLETEIIEIKTTFLKLMHKLGKSVKKIPQQLKRCLKHTVENLLNEIISDAEMNDNELESIFIEHYGMTYQEMEEKEVEKAKEELNSFAKYAGLDLNFDWLKAEMTEADVIKLLMQEKIQKYKNANKQKTERPKTKRQLEMEMRKKQAEELKNKNLSDIYKQLAKALHPDLESDHVKKEEKENLMKKLTAAYKAKDLHTLLSLELEWIHKEEGELEKLTDEKLGIYNEMLKAQVRELEKELSQMPLNPCYEPLFKYSTKAGMPSMYIPTPNELKRGHSTLLQRKKMLEEINESLRGKDSEKHFKNILKNLL
jgi:hypothetical protein